MRRMYTEKYSNRELLSLMILRVIDCICNEKVIKNLVSAITEIEYSLENNEASFPAQISCEFILTVFYQSHRNLF